MSTHSGRHRCCNVDTGWMVANLPQRAVLAVTMAIIYFHYFFGLPRRRDALFEHKILMIWKICKFWKHTLPEPACPDPVPFPAEFLVESPHHGRNRSRALCFRRKIGKRSYRIVTGGEVVKKCGVCPGCHVQRRLAANKHYKGGYGARCPKCKKNSLN